MSGIFEFISINLHKNANCALWKRILIFDFWLRFSVDEACLLFASIYMKRYSKICEKDSWFMFSTFETIQNWKENCFLLFGSVKPEISLLITRTPISIESIKHVSDMAKHTQKPTKTNKNKIGSEFSESHKPTKVMKLLWNCDEIG